MTRTLSAPGQDTLWDLAEPPATPAVPKPRKPAVTRPHPRPDRLDPDDRAHPCNPHCAHCKRPEHPDGLNYCQPACAILCTHMAPPGRTDVCVTLHVHVRARIVTSAATGDQHAIVVCPHPRCDRVHWHSVAPSPYPRTGQCGRPYIIHMPTEAAR